jgi:hypothetical protein
LVCITNENSEIIRTEKQFSKIFISKRSEDMAEVSDNAAIFIATSFQAIERAKFGIPLNSETVNLMVSLVFLGFYLEENLDVIIDRLNKRHELKELFGNRESGLKNKFVWFYNSYIALDKLKKFNKLSMDDLLKNLEARFPGFEKIYAFRNPVSHGKIKHSLSISEVNALRERAKAITSELLEIIDKKEGVVIEKNIDYMDAFINFEKTHPSI